jgi:CRISPR system Cascade subunit CasA
MNLIDDAWIPIRRKSGEETRIAPWEVTTRYGDDPIMAIAALRPDFNGALIQFLIGLLQTTGAPDPPRAWSQWLLNPPIPEELHAKFGPVVDAFELDGDGPRFMQDTTIEKSGNGKIHPFSYLLINSPTDNTLKKNADVFVKDASFKTDNRPGQICLPCAAAALFTLQTFAPSGGGGGEGKFTSLRGGGPLNTVVLGNTLWQTILLNVLGANRFKPTRPMVFTFPWLEVRKFLGKTIHSEEMNPSHVYWGMPRRIWLNITNSDTMLSCFLCGCMVHDVVTNFKDETGGLRYYQGDGKKKKPSWIHPRHPLSPYVETRDGLSTVPAEVGGTGYRYWLALVYSEPTTKLNRAPTIESFFADKAREYKKVSTDVQLWAFGYDMADAKARYWCEGMMPCVFVPEAVEIEYKGILERIINTAKACSGLLLLACLRAVWLEPEVQRKGQLVEVKWKYPKHFQKLRKKTEDDIEEGLQADQKTFFENIRMRYWYETEAEFYRFLQRLRDALSASEDVTPLLHEWVTMLASTARRIFDDVSQSGDFNAADLRPIAFAGNALNRALNGKKLRQLLGLAS